MIKITAAAAGIREQHDRSAGPANGAFDRRTADFDVSMLLQSHSPATRLTLDALKRLVAGGHRPEHSPPDVVKPSCCCWPKPDSIPESESGRETAALVIVAQERTFLASC